jgi:hemoglobin-like flavoprotein
MTPTQITLVQKSFAAVEPIAVTAARLFYTRLFQIDPSLRSMFTHDMDEQGQKLMQMLAFAVKGLGDLDSITPAIRALGLRHAGYGVREPHYDTVASALLWTLAQGLGDAFTPEVAESWTAAYTLLADTMKEAAEEAAA